MKFRVEIIKPKNKIFLHVLKGTCTEVEAREKIKETGYEAIKLVSKSETVFIFNITNKNNLQENIKMTDLTESYGASELPVFTLEDEEPSKPVRKTTTRKPRARRKTATTKKQTEN